MTTYSLNDNGNDVVKLQRYLNEVLVRDLKPDGVLGKVTQAALKQLQDKLNIVEKDPDGPVYGPITQSKILGFINKKYLNEEDYVKAASKCRLEVNIIKTVTSVEALEFGFFSNGLPVTLFERHKFYSYLCKNRGDDFANKIAARNPDICDPTAGGYVGGKSELQRLERARSIDETCALLSASYGLFQIMGFNYAQAGYKSVKEYYDAICFSEDKQLDAFVNYLLLDKDKSLLNNLKKKDFTAFAKEYNGPGYKKNNYDTKMMKAYQALSAK
jgi:peptidoglycan hydrolase-like protein with peptidoglycan-binding domain